MNQTRRMSRVAVLAAAAVLAPAGTAWADTRPQRDALQPTPGAEARVSALVDARAAGATGHDYGRRTAAAEAELPPTTVPTFVTPTHGSGVQGSVQLTVASTAPAVQFLLNGVPLGPVTPVVNGHASASWQTWGYEGAHTIGAADCTGTGTCATETASSVVQVTAGGLVLTAPASGALTSGPVTLKANAAGGTVKFLIDGKVRGSDSTAPYSIVVNDSLSDGSHTAEAFLCATAGSPCSTGDRVMTTFSAKSLHPKLSSLAKAAISPNGDGVADSTTATLRLESKQRASWSLVRSNGSTAAGPFSLGNLKAGRHTVAVPGDVRPRDLPDGTYSLVVRTSAPSGAVTLVGATSTGIRIDTTRPKLSGATGAGTKFYPVKDGYRDVFVPSGVVTEKSRLRIEIGSNKQQILRTMTKRASGGAYSFSWNGRRDNGKPVAPGTYVYRLTAEDAVGNVTRSGWSRVLVSNQKLVKKTATVTLDGADASDFGGSDPSCGWGSTSQSYSRGLLLMNACDPSWYELTAAFYNFRLPSAISYERLSLSVSGDSVYTPTSLGAGILNLASGDWQILEGTTATAAGTRVHGLGSINAAQLISGRDVEVAFSIDNTIGSGPWDFDIQDVRLTVTYRVLS